MRRALLSLALAALPHWAAAQNASAVRYVGSTPSQDVSTPSRWRNARQNSP